MYIYNKYNLLIESFSEIRTLRENEVDLDIVIDLNHRVVNLWLENLPDYLIDRFQFTEVKNLIIRISKEDKNNIATVHLLRSIDLKTSLLNFSINYESLKFQIINNEFNIDFHILGSN